MERAARVDERTAARLAALALVAPGVAAGAAQVLVFRELLVVCYGTELTIGLILSFWLLLGAAGTLYGRRLGRADEDLQVTLTRVAWLTLWPGAALFAGLALIRCAPWLLANLLPTFLSPLAALGPGGEAVVHGLALQPGVMLSLFHIVIVTVAGVSLPAAVDGCQFAAASRLYAHACRRLHTSAGGRAYAYDAIGHLLGGVALAWIALRLLDPFTTAAVGGLLNLAVGAALVCHCRRGNALRLSAAMIVTSALLVTLAVPLARWSLRVQWQGHRVLENSNSIYGNTVVTRLGSRGVCFFRNGMPTGTAPPMPTIQIPVHFAMTQVEHPRRVLLISGGVVGALKELLKYGDVRVDYLELDPRVFELARRWLPPQEAACLDDRRVNCVAVDARLFVKRLAAGGKVTPYDVVLVMLPGPVSAQLNRFYTVEWFSEVKRLLAPWGVVCFQIPSSTTYLSGPLLLLNKSLYATVQSVFRRLALLPSSDRLVVVGGGPAAKLAEDYGQVQQRLGRHRISASIFEREAYAQLAPFNRDLFLYRLGQQAPVSLNLDARPIAFFYYQSWWFQHFHHGSAHLLERLATLRVGHAFAVIIGLFAIWLGLCLRPAWRPSAVPGAVAVAGFAGMVAEVVIIFAFQAYYGYVYHQIGFITGAFMLGIAIGGMWVGRMVDAALPAWRLAAWLAWLQLAGAAVIALVPLLLAATWAWSGGVVASTLSANFVFPLLTLSIGVFIGAQFPVASLLWAAGRGGEAESVPLLFATDLIGAAAGALVAGALLMPVFGAVATCLLVATMSALVALLLAVYMPVAARA